jgi:hypothetical protein
MARLNWHKLGLGDRLRRNGFEDINGASSIHDLLPDRQPKRRQLSKAELREQAAAAMADYKGPIRRKATVDAVQKARKSGEHQHSPDAQPRQHDRHVGNTSETRPPWEE